MAGRGNGHLNPALPDTGQRDLGDWRLSARMNNLYDEQYCEIDATCVSGNGFSPTSERNLWIGVSYRLEVMSLAKRLTRIYTRRGDDGSTGLADGRRLPKDHARIEAIGAVDELNSRIGLLRALDLDALIDQLLQAIQHRLFDLGGELAMPGSELSKDARTTELEQALDRLNADLPALEDFILPGGNEAAARCHLARTGCRRAERELLRLSREEPVNSASSRYLNRLSDLLFVLARVLARKDGGAEITWQKGI